MRVFKPFLATVTAALLGFAGSLSMVAPAAAVTEEFRPGAESPTSGFASAWQVSYPSDLIAQAFTQTETGNLATVRIKVHSIDTGTDFTSMSIHEVDDETGPAADALVGGSSSAITFEEPDDSGQLWAEVSFADRPLLTEGTRYALVIDPSRKGDDTASFVLHFDWMNPVHTFTTWVHNGPEGWTGANTGFMIFTSQLVTRFVVPAEPTLKPAPECGIEATVALPEEEGVAYTETRDGDVITVTAAAAEGYTLAAGASTQWQFTVTAEDCVTDPEPKPEPEPEPEPEPLTVTPAAPTLEAATECGIEPTITLPQVEGITYNQNREGDTVTVTATAADGYAFETGVATEWQFTVTAEKCEEGPEEPSVTDPEEPQVTDPEGPQEPAGPSEPADPVTPKPTTDAKTPAAPASLASTGSNPGMIGLAAVAAITLGAALVVLRRARSARA